MRSVLRFLTSGLLTSILFATVAFSQGSQTGGLTGVVTDQQGAVVAGATVNVIRGRRLCCDAAAAWRISS